MKCPKCGSKNVTRDECLDCGIIISKCVHFEPSSRNQNIQENHIQENINVTKMVLVLPFLAFLFAPIFSKVLPKVSWAFGMWIHEFGHAFAGWWGGVAATPFLGWTNFAPNRSWVVTLCFTFLLFVLAYKCFERKCYFLFGSFVLMFIVQLYFRFFLSEDQLNLMFSFMGVGGEFWISTWLVIAYHHKFPQETHWQYLRYPLLFVGVLVFFHAFDLWWDISHKRAEIPWGSMWGGDDHGDMNSLLYEHGWSPNTMTRKYLLLGKICLFLMIFHYLMQVCMLLFRKNK